MIAPTSTVPAAPSDACALDQLDRHECAVVRRVDAGSDDMGRLQAMGVCAGRTLELIQRGDPLIIRILGSRIGLSARLAARVYVERCAHHCDLAPGGT
jgi:Fe2+ transport system protein FeoA